MIDKNKCFKENLNYVSHIKHDAWELSACDLMEIMIRDHDKKRLSNKLIKILWSFVVQTYRFLIRG